MNHLSMNNLYRNSVLAWELFLVAVRVLPVTESRGFKQQFTVGMSDQLDSANFGSIATKALFNQNLGED